ncbi:MAG: fused MFS/spermidine synthase [Planctomycetota bacterium]|nr:fused MFS/spermidine synthase [Planctomycetota bacterium]
MSDAKVSASQVPLRSAGVVAALVGFAIMGIELTAVRLLAPNFGDSAYVWTNVIGVILLALALGAWVGGRLAERPTGSPLSVLLVTAAALAALAPLVAPTLGGWLVPQDLPLDAAMPALVSGSLVATLLLFAPPIWFMGAIAPGLIVGAVRSGVATGRAAGAVSAAGTIGSLVGTFAATHWLVPSFGCRLTIWACAVVLLLAALCLRPGRRVLATAAVVALTCVLQGGPLREPLPGQELVAERETSYQFLQVVRSEDPDSATVRNELKINEGLDSFHSVEIEGQVFASTRADAPNAYYDYHALVPLLAGDGDRPRGLRALSLGDAAGTFRRIYAAVHPGATVDGVEIDPVAVELGETCFPGARAPGRVHTGVDGRVFINRDEGRWHVIHVDAYSHQVYIPAHLASQEFFAAAHRHLEPGGVVACNVGAVSPTDPVLVSIAETMASVFGQASALRVPGSRNYLLLARNGEPIRPADLKSDPVELAELGEVDAAIWRAMVDGAADPEAWLLFDAAGDGAVLVDDRPELDLLLHQSYFDVDDDAQPVSMAGPDSAASAEGVAYTALAAGNPAEALAAAQQSREPTAYLRYLAGSARWSLRQLRGAQAEYRAGLALQPDEKLRASLERQLQGLATELDPRLHAAEVADRNRWLALLLAALGALALWLGTRRLA